MNLKDIALEIKDSLEIRRKEIELTFIEDEHIYFMKDVDGEVKSDFPSVSKIIKKFYKPFDAEGKALQKANGDPEGAKEILAEWKMAGDLSTNMGSRVHYELESELVSQYGNYKEVRRPIFEINEEQKNKSDQMISAGKDFLNLMHERGAVLLDTEMVLGDPLLGYVGQPDKVWLMENKLKTDFGFVVTDYKTNQPKNFVAQWYSKKMYKPFDILDDTALGHYNVQLPLYAKLLIKMLEGTKFADKKLLGSVIVLLKESGSFEEYRVSQQVNNIVLNLDIKKYL